MNKTGLIAGLVLIIGTAVAFTGTSLAQQARPPIVDRGAFPPGQQGNMPPMMMMPGQGGGGGASIAANDKFVFVLRGDQLIKVDISTMKVAGESMLPRPKMDQRVPPPGDGQFERPLPPARGGGGAPGQTPGDDVKEAPTTKK